MVRVRLNADLKQRNKKKQTLNKEHNKPTMYYLIVLCQNGLTLMFMLHGTAVIRDGPIYLFIQQYGTPF